MYRHHLKMCNLRALLYVITRADTVPLFLQSASTNADYVDFNQTCVQLIVQGKGCTNRQCCQVNNNKCSKSWKFANVHERISL